MKRRVLFGVFASVLTFFSLFAAQNLYADENSILTEQPVTEETKPDSSDSITSEEQPEETTSDEVSPTDPENQPVDADEVLIEESNEDSIQNEDVVALNVSTQKGYASLKEAVEEASDQDTIQLAKNITMTESVVINKSITIDGANTIMTSSLTDDSASLLTVESGKSLSIKNVTIESSKSAKGRALNVQSGADATIENVTVRNFSTEQTGAVMHIDGGTVTIRHSTFSQNSALAGGAISLTNKGTLNITNSTFSNNTATLYEGDNKNKGGGAICIWNSSNATIDRSTFTSNRAPEADGGDIAGFYPETLIVTNSSFDRSFVYTLNTSGGSSDGGYGGSIHCMAQGTYVFENNTFTNCRASWGGAICFINMWSMKSAIFRNNTIQNCTVNGRGGAMRLYDGANAPGRIQLESGLMENNSANWGGAIDYTGHGSKTLELQNAVITGNSSESGGGIWLCPTSETTMYATQGAAIYGNTVTESSGGHGSDVQYEGKDTNIFYLRAQGISETTHADIASRMLGGGKVTWYKDYSKRYKEGDAPADPSLYTNTSDTFGLYGSYTPSSADLANSEAKLIIRNNKAGRYGGGIASNSPIVFGKDADISVSVQKQWEKTDQKPEQVTVTLYRVNAQGKSDALDENVILNEANNWQTTFNGLPSSYLDANGTEQTYSYEVKEDGLDANNRLKIGDELYESKTTGDMQNGFVITNTKLTPSVPLTPAYKNVKVVVQWKGIDPDEAPEVTAVLMKNDQATDQKLSLSQANAWADSFQKLPSIDPDKVTSDDPGDVNRYSAVEEGEKDGTITLDGVQYKVEYQVDKNTVTIINRKMIPATPLTPSFRNVQVLVQWEGIDSDDAPEVNVILIKNNQKTNQTLSINKGKQWTDAFRGLPSLDADKITSNDPAAINQYSAYLEGEVDGITLIQGVRYQTTYEVATNKIVIINKKIVPTIPLTPAHQSIQVIKKWEGIEESQAPDVNVVLMKNGEVTDQTLTLSQANGWTNTFTNLPVIDEDKIDSNDPEDANQYSVVEAAESNGKVTLNGIEYEVSYQVEGQTVTILNKKIESEKENKQIDKKGDNQPSKKKKKTTKTSLPTLVGLWSMTLLISVLIILGLMYKKKHA